MKTFVIVLCACAAAQAQFENSRYQTSSAFGQSSSSFGNSRFQNTQAPLQQTTRTPFNRNTFESSRYQNSQSNYQQTTLRPNLGQQTSFSQYQEQSRSQSSGSCRESNARYPVSGSCDRYIECINGTSKEILCPDGLRFNPNVNFNVYPCQYPADVPCLERSSLQPAQATADCPHQFGYFKLGDAKNCSSFRNCVNGVGFDFMCPEGLAFSSETYRCEWPDQVAECDVEAFLGFRCPNIPTTKELGEPAGYRFYRSDTNCQKYFICIEGKPRVLSCGGESGFDELTSTCVLADEISSCPQELRASAARSREIEQQRLAKELEINSLPQALKRRF